MKIYHIPANYNDPGYFFNGKIAKRNTVDALILAMLGFGLSRILPLPADYRLSVTILLVGLFGMIGVVGVKGLPISVYAVAFISMLFRKAPRIYNAHGGVYTKSAAEVMLDEPQMQDMIADAFDSLRKQMSSRRPDYIEGETFQFRQDPELAALKDAEGAKKNQDAPQEEDAPSKEPKQPKEDKEKPLFQRRKKKDSASKILGEPEWQPFPTQEVTPDVESQDTDDEVDYPVWEDIGSDGTAEAGEQLVDLTQEGVWEDV